MTVGELTTRMGVVEFRKWIAYFDKDAEDGELKDLPPEEIAKAFGVM